MVRLLQFLALQAALSAVSADHQAQECVDQVEDGVDLFPHKADPSDAEWFDIEYHNTYKIVTNKKESETYLLYQCGTSFPSDRTESDYTAVIEIPVKKVGLTQTPMITFMEQIGARDKIVAFLTDTQYISSPCFAENVEQGKVAVFENRTGTKQFYGDEPPTTTDILAFGNTWWADSGLFSHVVKVSAASEQTNAGIFEWALFYAAFFNYEETAMKVVEAANNRFSCVKAKTSQAVADTGVKPTLLWAYYSPYAKGWDVGECENYYCEMADACSVNILSSTEGSITYFGATYMTTEEFLNFGGKDADYWFYPSNNWDEMEAEFGDQIGDFKSVKAEHVYDYQGMGENSWFEQRIAEYYNVLEDMCVTVGTRNVGSSFHVRHFWRNVFTEPIPADGAEATCTADAAANILNDAHECGPTFGTASSESGACSVFGFFVSVFSMAVAVLLLA